MPHRSLERVASRWVPGAGPVHLQAASGLVNLTCRAERAGAVYSLRIAAESAHLGLDRHWECRVLGAAAAAGLAPRVETCAPDAGVVVCAWVAGATWTPAQILEPATRRALTELLRRVHALPIPQPPRRMSPDAWIAHYSALTATQRCAALLDPARLYLAALAASPAPTPVVCHGDVHRLNVLAGERVLLLDWEYAHVSEPFWDLAGWVANNDWSRADAARLLEDYLGRVPLPPERQRLAALVWLYDYVCLLWSELYINERPGAASAAIAARADQLTARLNGSR